jgi:hypothetical protein
MNDLYKYFIELNKVTMKNKFLLENFKKFYYIKIDQNIFISIMVIR